MSLLPGSLSSGIAFHPDVLEKLGQSEQDASPLWPIGIGREQLFSSKAVRSMVESVPFGQFATGHVPFSSEFHALLQERGWKSVTIWRDPRDIVISLAEYQAEKPNHPFASLTLEERIMRSIRGFDADANGAPGLLSIEKRCRRTMGWQTASGNLNTSFERLVGEQGGGSAKEQAAEISRLAAHLGIGLSEKALQNVITRAYGATTTFRTGMIGRWKKTFTEEHKRAFKHCDTLLAELGYETSDQW